MIAWAWFNLCGGSERQSFALLAEQRLVIGIRVILNVPAGSENKYQR